MATSAVSICNIALIELGASSISSFTEGTTEAKQCSALWDGARKYLLRKGTWNFAIKRIELAQDVDAPAFGFQYQYTLPSDLIRLIEVHDDFNYKVEGGKILTNSSTCKIKYVFDNTNVATWDSTFVDLMAARMRASLAKPITGSSSERDTAEDLFKEKLFYATGIDSIEDITDSIPVTSDSVYGVRF